MDMDGDAGLDFQWLAGQARAKLHLQLQAPVHPFSLIPTGQEQNLNRGKVINGDGDGETPFSVVNRTRVWLSLSSRSRLMSGFICPKWTDQESIDIKQTWSPECVGYREVM